MEQVFADGAECAVDLRTIGLLFGEPTPYGILDMPFRTFEPVRHCLGVTRLTEKHVYLYPVSLDQTEIG